MRILVDVAHPAEVHFYRHIITDLEAAGHRLCVTARDKDVVLELLDAFGIEHVPTNTAASASMLALGWELVRRDVTLWRIARRFGPDLILTRNPTGTHVGRLLSVPTILDSDDGYAGGPVFRLAKPFATLLTTPDCSRTSFGSRHVRYPGYKETAYLHPDRFTPRAEVLTSLELGPTDVFSMVRFVSLGASHDRNQKGLSDTDKSSLVERLAAEGRVLISAEGASLPAHLEQYRWRARVDELHHVLAHAAIYVGDSSSVAAEAAVLGVPSIRCSTLAHQLDYLCELEDRYQLTRAFLPEQRKDFFAAVDEVLDDVPAARATWAERRTRMLRDKVDTTSWYVDFIHTRFG